MYAEEADEGLILYMYDFNKDLWEQKYLIEFEEG